MSRFRPDRADRPATHDRARELAALRLTEPLPPEENAWLDAHLDTCRVCSVAAEAYAAQRRALRRLPAPQPPRDLWARTAVALDREQRRSQRRRIGRGASPVALGTLAAALVVAVVVGSSLLGGALRGPQTVGGSGSLALASALPTPISVAAARVVWASHQDDGTYALNVAPVDRVCRTGAEAACAPLDASARKLVALAFRPKAVVLSQFRPEAVVMGPGSADRVTSIFVVSLPSPAESPSPTSEAISSASGSTGPTATALSSASVLITSSPTIARHTSAPRSVSPTTSATSTLQASSSPAAASPSPAESISPVPSPAATLAILDDVVLAGDAAAYSPDGAWFAFSARPADGSLGPDIYVWRVGEARARAVTTDHSSIFSAWLGDKLLGSDMVAETATPDQTQPTAGGDPSASSDPPAPSDPSGSADSSAQSQPSGRSSGAASSSKPADSPSPGLTPSPGPSSSGAPEGAPDPSAGGATLIPHSFALDPATGTQESIGDGIWRPTVDPTGRLVLYWRGTLTYDPSTASWTPAQGDLYLAPWAAIAPADLVPTPEPSLSASPSESVGQSSTGSQGPSGSPEPSSSSAAVAASPTGRSTAPAAHAGGGASPTGSAPGRATAGASQVAPTDTAIASGSASGDGSGSSESPAPSPQDLLPPLLSPDSPPTGLGPTSWDARWDERGTHLAIWAGDPLDSSVGRLSLLTVDPDTAQVDTGTPLLAAAAALPGFSIDVDRVVWVTPPGQNGVGSRLEVLAWRGQDAGQIVGLPIPGTDQLVVAR